MGDLSAGLRAFTGNVARGLAVEADDAGAGAVAAEMSFLTAVEAALSALSFSLAAVRAGAGTT